MYMHTQPPNAVEATMTQLVPASRVDRGRCSKTAGRALHRESDADQQVMKEDEVGGEKGEWEEARTRPPTQTCGKTWVDGSVEANTAMASCGTLAQGPPAAKEVATRIRGEVRSRQAHSKSTTACLAYGEDDEGVGSPASPGRVTDVSEEWVTEHMRLMHVIKSLESDLQYERAERESLAQEALRLLDIEARRTVEMQRLEAKLEAVAEENVGLREAMKNPRQSGREDLAEAEADRKALQKENEGLRKRCEELEGETKRLKEERLEMINERVTFRNDVSVQLECIEKQFLEESQRARGECDEVKAMLRERTSECEKMRSGLALQKNFAISVWKLMLSSSCSSSSTGAAHNDDHDVDRNSGYFCPSFKTDEECRLVVSQLSSRLNQGREAQSQAIETQKHLDEAFKKVHDYQIRLHRSQDHVRVLQAAVNDLIASGTQIMPQAEASDTINALAATTISTTTATAAPTPGSTVSATPSGATLMAGGRESLQALDDILFPMTPESPHRPEGDDDHSGNSTPAFPRNRRKPSQSSSSLSSPVPSKPDRNDKLRNTGPSATRKPSASNKALVQAARKSSVPGAAGPPIIPTSSDKQLPSMLPIPSRLSRRSVAQLSKHLEVNTITASPVGTRGSSPRGTVGSGCHRASTGSDHLAQSVSSLLAGIRDQASPLSTATTRAARAHAPGAVAASTDSA